MTQAQNEMTMIVEEVKFLLLDFLDKDDDTNKDLLVHAYAQEYDEHDQYTILIYEKDIDNDEEELISELNFDSSGNTCEDDDEEELTYIEEEVIKILFSKREKGIIRPF